MGTAIILWVFGGVGNLLVRPVISLCQRMWAKMGKREFLPVPVELRVKAAQVKDLVPICRMAALYLGRNHAIQIKTARKWWLHNNKVFLIAECRDRPNGTWSFCGYAAILPLTEPASGLLISGAVQDYELTAESICRESESPDRVYIMDVMTNIGFCKKNNCCRRAGGLLLHRIRKIVHSSDASGATEAVTLVATDNGKKLAEAFGFLPDSEYTSPFDWVLYRKQLTE